MLFEWFIVKHYYTWTKNRHFPAPLSNCVYHSNGKYSANNTVIGRILPIPMIVPIRIHFYYTPGIYAAGYIVFALMFVRSYVCSFVRSLVCSCVRSFVTFRHVRRIHLKVFG